MATVALCATKLEAPIHHAWHRTEKHTLANSRPWYSSKAALKEDLGRPLGPLNLSLHLLTTSPLLTILKASKSYLHNLAQKYDSRQDS